MSKTHHHRYLALLLLQALTGSAYAGQARLAVGAPDILISSQDQVYLSAQISNTVSMVVVVVGKPDAIL